jgi:hypothetical protein
MATTKMEDEIESKPKTRKGPPRDLCYLCEGSNQLIVTPEEGSGIVLSCDTPTCSEYVEHDSWAYYDNVENHLLCPKCFEVGTHFRREKANYRCVLTFH